VQSGGQSPIEKYLALTDMEAGIKAVEYFKGRENFIQALTGLNSSEL